MHTLPFWPLQIGLEPRVEFASQLGSHFVSSFVPHRLAQIGLASLVAMLLLVLVSTVLLVVALFH